MRSPPFIITSIATFGFGMSELSAATESPKPPSPSRGIATVEFSPLGQPAENSLRLTYYRTAYDPPLRIEPVAREEWDPSTPENAYRGWLTANQKGDSEWIAITFAPNARDKIRQTFNNEALLAKNTHHFEKVAQTFVYEVIAYGDYRVVISRHEHSDGSSVWSDLVFESREKGWFVTHDLKSDPAKRYLLKALQEKHATHDDA